MTKNQLTGICGPVGCGKTSLILAILSELKCTSGSFTLRSSNIAYVSQNPWLISGSIRNNIIFGKKFRKGWFDEVIKSCGLEVDFKGFPEGDQTIIGPSGQIISGGQKARIALARAVYSDADIYLLDDPLAAGI